MTTQRRDQRSSLPRPEYISYHQPAWDKMDVTHAKAPTCGNIHDEKQVNFVCLEQARFQPIRLNTSRGWSSSGCSGILPILWSPSCVPTSMSRRVRPADTESSTTGKPHLLQAFMAYISMAQAAKPLVTQSGDLWQQAAPRLDPKWIAL